MAHSDEDLSSITIRPHLRNNRRPKPGIFEVATIVCLVLLALLVLVQVTHVHAIASDGDHCPICILMHSLVLGPGILAGVVLVRIRASTLVLLEARTIIRYWHPTLYTRPPPTSC